MMRSLWSGVSGLQAHQTAMDVEGDNIANVNTTGFKYSRVSFASMLSQTSSIATAPQGDLGGTNPSQVGLGTQVSSTTTIFQQGSIESTDKTTDLAIQGEGFFIVSGDDGDSYKYTRDGDFNFDADGNFVDNNGYVIQGWVRDDDTGEIDSSSPIQSIQIDSGLTTPANATSYVSLQANLNSGNSVENKSAIFSLDSVSGGYDSSGNGVANITHDEDGADYIYNDGELYETALDFGVLYDPDGNSLVLQEDQGMWISYAQTQSTAENISGVFGTGSFSTNINGQDIYVDVSSAADTAEAVKLVKDKINTYSDTIGVEAELDGNELTLVNDNSSGTNENSKNIIVTDHSTIGSNTLTTASYITAYSYSYTTGSPSPTAGYGTVTRTFTNTEDLRISMQYDAENNIDHTHNGLADLNEGVEVSVNSSGQYSISNDDDDVATDYDMVLKVTNFTDDDDSTISVNSNLTDVFSALEGNLTVDGKERTSQSLYTANHASSIDVYDSLGSKHTVRFEFTKIETSTDSGASWLMVASVDAPAELNGDIGSENIITDIISFNSDGSLRDDASPLSFSPNNGASGDQNIALSFGSINSFDGLTSFDSESSTSGISQDGYTGGDLEGLEVDETGTIIGSFTNGRSFGLAQVAMASFSNEVGLESDGGNTFVQTSNSGDPVIGVANAGGRGYIQSSALEMSNVDLSTSLTELIVIQRGFQANSKTITTSDEMLQTLLQLK